MISCLLASESVMMWVAPRAEAETRALYSLAETAVCILAPAASSHHALSPLAAPGIAAGRPSTAREPLSRSLRGRHGGTATAQTTPCPHCPAAPALASPQHSAVPLLVPAPRPPAEKPSVIVRSETNRFKWYTSWRVYCPLPVCG